MLSKHIERCNGSVERCNVGSMGAWSSVGKGLRLARSSEDGHRIELLGAGEVAALLGVKESTVWRWCREGRLPALKAGKHWRVRREVLEDFLKRGESPATLVGQLDTFLRVPDNVLAVAEDEALLHRLDAAFFQVGEKRGGLLVKFHGGEESPEQELLDRFEQNGFEGRRLVREGRLFMRPEEDPLGARADLLGRFIEEEVGEGRTVWASFDWTLRVDLRTALEQQDRLAQLVDARQLVVKTAAIEGVIAEWSSVEFREAQSKHSGTILVSESGLSMSRSTPLPPS